MAGPSFTQTYFGAPVPVSPSSVVGSTPPSVWTRSVIDARRMMNRRLPQAEYGAGYLGTITERNSDKVLDSLKARVNQRSYQRGVHLGERIDPGDYLNPDQLNPLRGIQRQATTRLRNAPLLEWFQPTPTVEGKLAPRGSESIMTIDEHRATQLGMLRPRYGLPTTRSLVQT